MEVQALRRLVAETETRQTPLAETIPIFTSSSDEIARVAAEAAESARREAEERAARDLAAYKVLVSTKTNVLSFLCSCVWSSHVFTLEATIKLHKLLTAK